MKANIFKIDRLNTHNGPGFRTVIYFKGCPLHCTWCHNPESLKKKKQVWVQHVKCIACGICKNTCSNNAISLIDSKIEIDHTACVGCQECANACPTSAIEKIGKDYSIDELMRTILKDKFLYESSGGGITATGGEPGFYIDFVTELFKQCKKNGIQTAFDTSGAIVPNKLEKLIGFTDILYLDLKIYDNEKSVKYTGLKQSQLIDTINWLKEQEINPNLQIEFRTPIIPGITDGDKNLEAFAEKIVAHFPGATWELCMFNDLCQDKYIRLKMDWTLKGNKQISSDFERIELFSQKHKNLSIHFSGFSEDFSNFNMKE